MDKGEQTMPVRISKAALEAARIAAAYRGMSVMDYVSQLVLAGAERDIEESHRMRAAGTPLPRPERPKQSRRKPKGGTP
jgi:hypothetical protein